MVRWWRRRPIWSLLSIALRVVRSLWWSVVERVARLMEIIIVIAVAAVAALVQCVEIVCRRERGRRWPTVVLLRQRSAA